MFEILSAYQEQLAEQLSMQISGGTFSQVNLFGGERYSLRMSFAIEACRVLSCERDGLDQCSCPSCRRFATLSVPNLVIVSQRDHTSLIEASLSTYSRLANDFSRNLVIQSIRRMLLQYHPALQGGSPSQREGTAYEAAAQVNELLLSLAKEKTGDVKAAGKQVEALLAELKSLYAANKKNTTVTISQVRALDEWINQTSMGSGKRFIILEALELANNSARNSLLKMLEEPPKDVYFFLLSENPNRIMQTILSRVRRYTFPVLSPQAVSRFLQPFYLHDKVYERLESFVLEAGGLDLDCIEKSAQTLFSSLVSGRYLTSSPLATLIAKVDDMGGSAYLMQALLSELEKGLQQGSVSLSRARRLSRLINETYYDAQQFNQNGKLMMEHLYYRMMEEA